MKIQVVQHPASNNPMTLWAVIVEGRSTTPTFRDKGAAEAYAAMIQDGRRKPEFYSTEE